MSLRRFSYFSLVVVLSLSLVACAGKQQANNGTSTSQEFQSDVNAPDWFFSPPEKDGSLFSAATAKSSRMSVALNKAKLKANRSLAGSISSTLQGQRERYVEEIGNTADEKETATREQYQDLTREMVDQELKGLRLAEKGIIKEGSGYRAYVLMELTMNNFKDQLSNKEELKTRFNAKQFEEDMEENLDKMRENQRQ